MRTAIAVRRGPRRDLPRSLVVGALSILSGCYESHVVVVPPPGDGGNVVIPPAPDGGHDAGSLPDAGDVPDATPPLADAGPPPVCTIPQPSWAIGTGDDANQFARDVAMDADGNTYVVGYFAGTLANLGNAPFLASQTFQDAWVAKLSPSGDVLWRRRFSAGWSFLTAIALDADGHPIVGGGFAGDITLDGFTFPASGGQDGLVARLDAEDGHVLNAARLGGAERTSVADLAVDTASATPSVIAVGSFDDCPFGGSTTPCPASALNDILLVRLDDDLVIRRKATFGSSGYQQAWGVDVDGAGRIAVAGDFENTLAFGAPTATLMAATASPTSDVFVATFDLPADPTAAFAPVWSVAYGPGGCANPLNRKGTDVAFGLPTGARSDVYVVGDFSGCIFVEGARDDATGAAGVTDSFVARLDGEDGTTLDKLILANSSWQQLTSIERDRDGSLLVGGTSAGTLPVGTETLTSFPGRQGMILFRIAPPMTVDWARTYGGPTSHVSLVNVSPPPPGSASDRAFSVSGVYLSEVIFDPDPDDAIVASSGGGTDAVVAAFACEP